MRYLLILCFFLGGFILGDIAWNKTRFPSQVKMPKELKEWGKIPFLEHFDTLTAATASWVFVYDENGKLINCSGWRWNKEKGKLEFYTHNKGIFEKGYMYGVGAYPDEKPIKAYLE